MRHRAQNLTALIDRFNFLSLWVGAVVVRTYKLKQRRKVLEKFIKILKVVFLCLLGVDKNYPSQKKT